MLQDRIAQSSRRRAGILPIGHEFRNESDAFLPFVFARRPVCGSATEQKAFLSYAS